MRTSGLLTTFPAAVAVATALMLSACTSTGSHGSGPGPSASQSTGPSASGASPSSSPSPSGPVQHSAAPPHPPTATPGDGGPGPTGDHVRGIVSAGGAAKGSLEKVSTVLADEAAVQAYKARLAPSLQKPFLAEAHKLMKQVPEGQYLHVQTVYDGCEKPSAATIAAKPTSGGVALTVKPPASTTKECFVAERSVAFLSLGKMAG